MGRYQSIKKAPIVSWYKNIGFSAPLAEVDLVYAGPPRVSADEVKQREAQAYEKGRQSAIDELNQQILSNRGEVQHLIGETLEQLNQKVEQHLREMFEEIPGLVTNIARRILADVELDGNMVKGIVDDLIADLPNHKDPIEIYLCPQDLKLLMDYLEQPGKDFPNCHFNEDPKLKPGDCRVQSNFGAIDGRIETKLKHIEDQLRS